MNISLKKPKWDELIYQADKNITEKNSVNDWKNEMWSISVMNEKYSIINDELFYSNVEIDEWWNIRLHTCS